MAIFEYFFLEQKIFSYGYKLGFSNNKFISLKFILFFNVFDVIFLKNRKYQVNSTLRRNGSLT